MERDIVRKTGLSNDIRVLSEKIPHVRSCSIGVWITRGSRHESREKLGISHLLEHMVFKGTERRTAKDIAYALESVGGNLNAFTEHEHTCYYARILDEHLPLALDVISDLLLNSTFDEKELEKEKQVVFEEIRNLEDTPDEMVHQLFRETIWGDGPLGRSGLGTYETIANTTPEDLRDFIKREYTSDRVVVVVAGNLDHEKLVDLVKDSFAFPQHNGHSPTSEIVDESRPTKPGQHHYANETSQTHTCIGTLTFPHSHRLRFPLLILSTALGGGMSSRLFQAVREREGLAYSVYSFQQFYKDTGFGGTYVSVEPNNLQKTIDLITEEYSHILAHGITEEDLISAKNQLKGQLMLGLESTNARMFRLAGYEINGEKFLTLDEVVEKIQNVSPDNVSEVAQLFLSQENLWRVSLGPKERSGALRKQKFKG